MKHYYLFLTSMLFVSVAQAQTTPTPQPGYTYKVETAIPGKLVYISGQRPFNADGTLVGTGSFIAQTKQVFENLQTSLKQVGMSMADVTQITYHVKNTANDGVLSTSQDLIRATGATFFGQSAPSIADVKTIPKIVDDGVLIEVEVIAIK